MTVAHFLDALSQDVIGYWVHAIAPSQSTLRRIGKLRFAIFFFRHEFPASLVHAKFQKNA